MFKSFKKSSEALSKRLDDARARMTPRERYRNDFQTRIGWMDFGVIKKKGRAYEPNESLIPVEEAMLFPVVETYNLHGEKSILPQQLDTPLKFVGFSSNQVGGMFVSSWLKPFYSEFKGNKRVLFI